MQSNRCYLESCRVLLDYADDVEEAVVVLLEGSYWEEALRQLYLHNRLDLLETNVLPALLEARESRLTLFTNLHSDFKHHSSRLAIVRETKKLRQAAIFGEWVWYAIGYLIKGFMLATYIETSCWLLN